MKLLLHLHEGHAGLAFSQYKMGRLKSAKKNLEKALEATFRKTLKNTYEKRIIIDNNTIPIKL